MACMLPLTYREPEVPSFALREPAARVAGSRFLSLVFEQRTNNTCVEGLAARLCTSRLVYLQVRSLLRSHSQGERSRASLAPGLYHPSPSIFSPSWSDRQGAVDDGAITGLRMRRSSAVRRPTPCHFSSLSSLLVHSSLFFRPTHDQVCRAFANWI